MYLLVRLATLFRLCQRTLADSPDCGRNCQNTQPVLLQTNILVDEPEKGLQMRADKILAFISVSANTTVMNLARDNVAHLRLSMGRENVDVYMVHYDLKKKSWLEHYPEWYSQNVQFAAEQSGLKPQHMQKLLSGFNMSKYTWVWALDEDIDLTGTDMIKFLQLASMSKAEIVMPAAERVAFPHQKPNLGCSYRYADVIDVMFPVFRPDALKTVLLECEHCIQNESTWGLSRVWCHFLSRKRGIQRGRACAVVDETLAVHVNFKSHPKYAKGNHTDNRSMHAYRSAEQAGHAAQKEVRRWHPEDYVAGCPSVMWATECVDKAGISHLLVPTNAAASNLSTSHHKSDPDCDGDDDPPDDR
eukprot:TRINITY_DN11348_c0_g2_i1.p1 TRINITY_DN11348_c0_g2~~TRINITY_DN11348_c0_g2_i1.p1  ORF type:complete len:359 (+),score=45.39 TRINITY_DN11348_c0_g2_i1:90-1166(+)